MGRVFGRRPGRTEFASTRGNDGETCGVHLALEGDSIQAASFLMPQPEGAGDLTAERDAARLSLRNGSLPATGTAVGSTEAY